MKALTLSMLMLLLLVGTVSAGLIDYEVHQEGSKTVVNIGGGFRKGLDGGVWKPIEEIDNLLLENEIGCSIVSDGKTKVQNKQDLQCSKIRFNKTTKGYDLDINLSAISDLALNKPIPIDIVKKELNKTSKQIQEVRTNLNEVTFLHKDWGQLWRIENIGFGDVLHIGEQSTELILVANGSGLLGDTVIQSGSPATNNGGAVNLYLIQGVDIALVQWNISAIPVNQNITEASANLTSYTSGNGACSAINASGYSKYTEYEFTETYNTKAAMTPLINQSGGSDAANAPTTFNVTSWVRTEYANGYKNLSIAFGAITCAGTDGQYYSGESVAGVNAPTLRIVYDAMPNNIPAIASASMNYTNATLFRTGENINASVSLTDADAGDKHNFTIRMFINDVLNTTYQNYSNFVSGTFSYVLQNTNISAGNKVTIQFNATDGTDVSNYLNATAVTVNNTITINTVGTNTTSNYINNSYYTGQILDYLNVTITDTDSTNVLKVNITIYNSTTTLIVNQSMTNLSYSLFVNDTNTTLTGASNWTIRIDASNNYGSVSNLSNMEVKESLHTTAEAHDTGTIVEGQTVTYYSNYTVKAVGVSNMSAFLQIGNLTYNTSLSTTTAGTDGTMYGFNVTTQMPATSSNPETKQLQWHYAIDYTTGITRTGILTNFTQVVNQTSLGICNATLTAQIYNFTLREEFNFTNLSGIIEGTFTLWNANGTPSINRTFNIDSQSSNASTTVNSLAVCISPLGYYAENGMVNYQVAGYDPRQHYFVNQVVNTSQPTTNISLLSLQISLANRAIISVTDDVDVGLPEKVVRIERYDVGTNTYHTIAMTKSDQNGQDTVFLRYDDAPYRFTVLDRTGTLYTSAQQKVTGTVPVTLIFRIVSTTISQIYQTFKDIIYDFQLTGLNFSLTYNDTLSRTSQHCLKVIRRQALNDTTLSTICKTGYTGSMSYNITNRTGNYLALYYATINPTGYIAYIPLEVLESASADALFGAGGLFLGVIIIGIIGLMGLHNPIVAITLSLVGLGIGSFFGLLTIPLAVLIGVVCVGILIMMKMRT